MARSSAKGTGAAFRVIEATAAKRKHARQSPFEAYAARPSFDFDGIDPAGLCDGINHVVARGAAITFSMTKDGGAVKCSLWLDNHKFEAYAADSETFNALMGVLTDVEDQPADETP